MCWNISALLIVFIFCGCSSLEVKIPLASIKSPEVLAAGKKQINFSANSTKTLTTTNDASKRPPKFVSEISNSTVFNNDFNYGKSDSYMIGGGVSSDLGLYFQVQYQFQNSIQDDIGWCSSVFAHAQYDSTDYSGDQKGTFGPGGYDWKAQLTESQAQIGLSTGYRLNKNIMIYTGLAVNKFSTQTKIEQKVSNDGSDLGGNYYKSSSGQSQSLGLGLQFGNDKISLKPVLELTTFSFEDINESTVLGSLTLTANVE